MKKSKGWISFNFGAVEPTKEPPKPSKTKEKLEKPIIDFNLLKKLKPRTTEDLAVHSKKVKEVQLWLEQNVCKKTRGAPILLITGPTGSGKTATINVLCNTLGLRLIEWVNPIEQDFYSGAFQSQISRFTEFFMQSKYTSLCSDSNNAQVILVEDFPNFIINNPLEFPEILKKCLCGGSGIIFICTDASADKVDLSQKLFSQDLKEELNITTICFNPCSSTLLKGALKRAQNHLVTQKDHFCSPNAEMVEAIISSSMGDIRCAINQYQFAAIKGLDSKMDISKTLNMSQGTKRKRPTTSSIKSMLKDEKLGFFHGLGRILNPKRITTNGSWRIQCDFNTLIEEFSVQPMMFNAFLQENYLKYFSELLDVQKAADILSEAQVFLEKWDERQDAVSYALWISAMGLMVYNEHKVSKWNQIRAPIKINLKSNKANPYNIPKTDLLYYNIITKESDFHTFNAN